MGIFLFFLPIFRNCTREEEKTDLKMYFFTQVLVFLALYSSGHVMWVTFAGIYCG